MLEESSSIDCVEFRVTNCRMREIVVDSCMDRETRSCIVPSIGSTRHDRVDEESLRGH